MDARSDLAGPDPADTATTRDAAPAGSMNNATDTPGEKTMATDMKKKSDTSRYQRIVQDMPINVITCDLKKFKSDYVDG